MHCHIQFQRRRNVGHVGGVNRGLLVGFTDPDVAMTKRKLVSSMDLGIASVVFCHGA